MKTKNLALKIVTMVFSALWLVPMFTAFVTRAQDVGNTTFTHGFKLADWKANSYMKMGGLVTITKILFYIAFAAAMALIALEIVRIVLKKKNNLVDAFTKVCSILVLVLGIVVFVFATVWCLANITKTLGNPVVYLPYYGAVITFVVGLVAGICGLKDLKA